MKGYRNLCNKYITFQQVREHKCFHQLFRKVSSRYLLPSELLLIIIDLESGGATGLAAYVRCLSLYTLFLFSGFHMWGSVFTWGEKK